MNTKIRIPDRQCGRVVRKMKFEIRKIWTWVRTSWFTSCVILKKSLTPSEPHSLFVKYG
jgi:hypothetical protein